METSVSSQDNCSNCRHWQGGFVTAGLNSFRPGKCMSEKVRSLYGDHGTHNHTPACEHWSSSQRTVNTGKSGL
jgi:hypothetical protein